MKTIKLASLLIAISIFTIACDESFLDRTPLDQVNSEIIFLQPTDMQIYMNQFYNDQLLPTKWYVINPIGGTSDDLNSDNQVTGLSIDARLRGTRTETAVTGQGWNFSYVRSINFFFDNYKRCKAPFADYKQYVGEAHFFRALIYFRLLQNFGAVPWYSSTLKTNSTELYAARTPRNIVADNIIADLDTAVANLSTAKGNGYGRINKWVALLIQSRVALYEGTWEKYHNGTVFGVTNAQPDKYLNKAAAAASEIMDSNLYGIYSTGNPASDYYDLFKMRDYASSKEVLFWKKFSSALNINNNRNFLLERPQQISITKSLADSYLCTDGKPISGNALFQGYATITDEMKNRDPRFSQTIFSPAAPWQIATSTLTWNDVYIHLNDGQMMNSAPTGYVMRKFYDPVMANHSLNYEETPNIHFRYAEVLLNYAEAKAELGTITQADLDKSIGLLRARVGMPGLSLAGITADPNWAFPTLSPVINEIRRERRVELATEGLRWPDIARWAAAEELIVGKRPKGLKAAQLPANVIGVDSNGFLDPFQTALPSGYGFVPERDYLDPIPLPQLVLNPQLVQNPGWPTSN